MSELSEKIQNRSLPTDFVDVPEVGKVEVRGLSRDEVRFMQEKYEDLKEREHWIIATGTLDLDVNEEVAEIWCGSAIFDEVNTVTHKILELSGLLEASAKRDYKSDQ